MKETGELHVASSTAPQREELCDMNSKVICAVSSWARIEINPFMCMSRKPRENRWTACLSVFLSGEMDLKNVLM